MSDNRQENAIWQIEAVVTGIRKRERKVKRHYIEICEVPDTGSKPDVDPLYIIDAQNEVKAQMRSWERVELQFMPMKLVRYDYGKDGSGTLREINLFDPRMFRVAVEVAP